MKTVSIQHGCAAPDICRALPTHTCGSTDACNAVKATGHVCTFGTTQRVTFHEQADIDAEVAAMEQAIKDVDPAAHAAMTALDKAKIKAEVRKGKNIHSAKAERDATDAGHKHGVDNKALHDSNPAVFGHA